MRLAIMDCRVKPGNDAAEAVGIASLDGLKQRPENP